MWWQTSLISLILQPPLPMSEPHWLAGTTRRMVTGGLLVAVLLVIEVLMSWRESDMMRKLTKCQSFSRAATRRFVSDVASKSNLLQFLNDHGEGFENRGGGSREGYDPLRTVAFWDVDASTALHRQRYKSVQCYHITQDSALPCFFFLLST